MQMDLKSADIPDFTALRDRISSLSDMSKQLEEMSKKYEQKCKEADTFEKSWTDLLTDYAEALAESKYFAARLDKTRQEKEKLEEKQTDSPEDIVKIIAELRFEVDTLYDILKNYHRAAQKIVPMVMKSIMQDKDPKAVVKLIEKQLDCASLEASSRLLLENDLPTNQAIKFSEYLDKNSFDSIRKTPVPDPKNPEGMEMDS